MKQKPGPLKFPKSQSRCPTCARPLPRRATAAEKKTAKGKAEGAQAARARSAAIRGLVMVRAGGVCEVEPYMGRFFAHMRPLVLDHWLGGSGRRRQKQSVENTWAICTPCHRERTVNSPNAAYWNEKFRQHCQRYGYPFTPHVEHAELARRPK